MAKGRDAARDLRYGRRAGRWASSTAGTMPMDAYPPCDVCARPMVVGQKRRHMACCIARGDHRHGGKCAGCGM